MVSCLDLPQFPHALGGTASRAEPTVIYVNLAALPGSRRKSKPSSSVKTSCFQPVASSLFDCEVQGIKRKQNLDAQKLRMTMQSNGQGTCQLHVRSFSGKVLANLFGACFALCSSKFTDFLIQCLGQLWHLCIGPVKEFSWVFNQSCFCFHTLTRRMLSDLDQAYAGEMKCPIVVVNQCCHAFSAIVNHFLRTVPFRPVTAV